MSEKLFFVSGSILGFLGVVIGAFAAHVLKTKLSGEMFNVFEVGARYHMYHAFALLVVAWAVSTYQIHFFQIAGWCFISGIFVFSGSLYILTLTGVKAWGAVTPIGGLFLLAGWFFLTFGAFKLPQ